MTQWTKEFESRIALGRADVKRQEDRLAWASRCWPKAISLPVSSFPSDKPWHGATRAEKDRR